MNIGCNNLQKWRSNFGNMRQSHDIQQGPCPFLTAQYTLKHFGISSHNIQPYELQFANSYHAIVLCRQQDSERVT